MTHDAQGPDPKTIGVAALPGAVRERLQQLADRLEATLRDHLVGILVHGSVVRGEYRPGESNVDVVVILDQADFAQLDAIGEAMQLARYAARIEVTILLESEIAGASDVFPLLYDDIKQCHVVVFGRDPFATVEVHDTHRRLRIEQELRDAQIRLRRAVADAASAREAVAGAVLRKVKQVRAPLHALLGLKRVACAADLNSVLACAGTMYGIDVAPLRSAREAPEAAHAALVALLTKAIADVDGFSPAT